MKEGDEKWDADIGGERKKRIGGKERKGETIGAHQPANFFSLGRTKKMRGLPILSSSNSAQKSVVLRQELSNFGSSPPLF